MSTKDHKDKISEPQWMGSHTDLLIPVLEDNPEPPLSYYRHLSIGTLLNPSPAYFSSSENFSRMGVTTLIGEIVAAHL